MLGVKIGSFSFGGEKCLAFLKEERRKLIASGKFHVAAYLDGWRTARRLETEWRERGGK